MKTDQKFVLQNNRRKKSSSTTKNSPKSGEAQQTLPTSAFNISRSNLNSQNNLQAFNLYSGFI